MPKKKSTTRSGVTRRVLVRPVTADDWPMIERLFGPNGACGGCWCMYWRLPRGGKLWEEKKGAPNKRAFKKLVNGGAVKGCLAFIDDEPVGWCCVGPRADFPRLERTRALAVEWDEHTWSVVCFYIKSKWRRHGVGSALLKGAVAVARQGGANVLHGYPVRPSKSGDGIIPAAFAWTGVSELFQNAGFRDVTPPGHSRDIFIKRFRAAR